MVWCNQLGSVKVCVFWVVKQFTWVLFQLCFLNNTFHIYLFFTPCLKYFIQFNLNLSKRASESFCYRAVNPFPFCLTLVPLSLVVLWRFLMKICHPALPKKENVARLNLFYIQPQNDKRASLAHLWLPRRTVPGMSLGQGLYLSALKWRHSVGPSSTWQTAASIVGLRKTRPSQLSPISQLSYSHLRNDVSTSRQHTHLLIALAVCCTLITKSNAPRLCHPLRWGLSHYLKCSRLFINSLFIQLLEGIKPQTACSLIGNKLFPCVLLDQITEVGTISIPGYENW